MRQYDNRADRPLKQTYDYAIDQYSKLGDPEKIDFAYRVYTYGTEGFDNPMRRVVGPKGIEYIDDEGREYSDYLLNDTNQLDEAIQLLIENGADKDDFDALFAQARNRYK